MGRAILGIALRVSLTYGILSGLWIVLSDRALALFVRSPQLNLALQTYKGWAFVLVTGILLFITLRDRLLKWENESTGRKEAEAALEEQETRYRSLVQNLAMGVLIVDTTERIIFANPASEMIFAGGRAEILGMNLRDFMSREEFDHILAETGRRLRGETSTYEIEIRRLDGEVRHLQVTATPQYDSERKYAGALATFQDITEQTHLKQRVEEERAQLLTLINNLPDGVYLKDRESRFILANRAVAEIVGFRDPKDLIGKTDYDFYQREMADGFRAGEREVMEEVRPIFNKLEPPAEPGKPPKWVLTTKVPIIDQAGKVRGLVGLSRDITAQKEAEIALVAGERKYQSIVDNITDALFIHDFHGTIIDVNENACRMHGYRREELDWGEPLQDPERGVPGKVQEPHRPPHRDGRPRARDSRPQEGRLADTPRGERKGSEPRGKRDHPFLRPRPHGKEKGAGRAARPPGTAPGGAEDGGGRKACRRHRP